MSRTTEALERSSSSSSGDQSNGSYLEYNVDMETRKITDQNKQRSVVKAKKIDVLKRNLHLRLPPHSHPHVGKFIRRLVKKTLHKPHSPSLNPVEISEHESCSPSLSPVEIPESPSPTSPLPPLSFGSTPTFSTLPLSTPAAELLSRQISTPSRADTSSAASPSRLSFASSTTYFPDVSTMESSPQAYSTIMTRDRKTSISEAMQFQLPSRASSRRNTLTEKMPDLTPSHLNLVPPSPPMSPPPHTPTSQISFRPSSSPRSTTTAESESDILSARMDKTIQTLLEGYSSLDVPTLLAPLSESFTHRVLPASLDMPARDKEAFSEHAAGIFSVFDQFAMVPEEIHTDLSNRSVTIHARMEGLLKQPKLDWKNECVMIVRLSPDGTEVTEITEFVDSHKAMEMRARHAPKHFDAGSMKIVGRRPLGFFSRMGMAMGMPGLAGERVMRWAGGSVLFTCIAAQTFWSVRKWLNGN